ncbi:MAG: hypothetical protein ACOY46_03925 [Bacillota bacterium]
MNKLISIHSWMEKNLERPFFEAEMARAVPSGKKGGFYAAIHLTVAGGVVLTVGWILLTIV